MDNLKKLFAEETSGGFTVNTLHLLNGKPRLRDVFDCDLIEITLPIRCVRSEQKPIRAIGLMHIAGPPDVRVYCVKPQQPGGCTRSLRAGHKPGRLDIEPLIKNGKHPPR
jgi:hypothetical protein